MTDVVNRANAADKMNKFRPAGTKQVSMTKDRVVFQHVRPMPAFQQIRQTYT